MLLFALPLPSQQRLGNKGVGVFREGRGLADYSIASRKIPYTLGRGQTFSFDNLSQNARTQDTNIGQGPGIGWPEPGMRNPQYPVPRNGIMTASNDSIVKVQLWLHIDPHPKGIAARAPNQGNSNHWNTKGNDKNVHMFCIVLAHGKNVEMTKKARSPPPTHRHVGQNGF